MAELSEEVLDVRPRQTIERGEAERGVLRDARPPKELRRAAALGDRDLARAPLHLRDWL